MSKINNYVINVLGTISHGLNEYEELKNNDMVEKNKILPYFFVNHSEDLFEENSIYNFARIMEIIGNLNMDIQLDSFLPADKSLIEEMENNSGRCPYIVPDNLSLSYIITSCLCYIKNKRYEYAKALSNIIFIKIKNFYEITKKDWEVVEKYPDYYYNEIKMISNELLGDLCMFFDKDLAYNYYNISSKLYNSFNEDSKSMINNILVNDHNFQVINGQYKNILFKLFELEYNYEGLDFFKRIKSKSELLTIIILKNKVHKGFKGIDEHFYAGVEVDFGK